MNPSVTTAPPARPVERVADSQVVMEGAGVPVRRVLPSRLVTYNLVDPFLLLDHFRVQAEMAEGGFPPHPHRGFEIITYMIAGGSSHSDSEGNQGIVHAGGLQRITAGRGIWHGEGLGAGESGSTEGLQLWINLGRRDKQVPPGYQGVEAGQFPLWSIGEAQVKVLVGEGSPTELRTPARYFDVTLPAGGSADLPLPADYQGFAYLLSGDGLFGSNRQGATAGQVAVLGAGGPLPVVVGAQGARFVLAAGAPHREPVRWNGPFID